MLLHNAIALAGAGVAAILVLHQHEVEKEEEERRQSESRMRPRRNRPRVYRYRPVLPVPEGPEFDLDTYNDVFCIEYFRFTQTQLRLMLHHFDLGSIEYRYRQKCRPETALCIVLYRLSSPTRYKEIMSLFRRSRPWLAVIFNDVICHLIERYRNKLEWDSNRLTRQTLERYAAAVGNVANCRNVWGFIDGTMRAINRPKENQNLFYSGYKKCHALKYQAVTTPDGLMSHMSGPWEGHCGDFRMYVESGLRQRLEEVNRNGLGQDIPADRLYIYGDPAYGLSYGILSGYKVRPGRPLTAQEREHNRVMSTVRISVEHGFGKVMMLWSFNGFKNKLKVGLSPVAAYFMVSVLLSNIHTCFNGSQTSQQFNCEPPPIGVYLYLSPEEQNS